MVYHSNKDKIKCEQYQMNMFLKALMNRYPVIKTEIIYSKKNDCFYVVSANTSKKAV